MTSVKNVGISTLGTGVGISTLGTGQERWNINTRNLDLVKKYSDFFTTGKFLKHLGSKFLEGCLLSS